MPSVPVLAVTAEPGAWRIVFVPPFETYGSVSSLQGAIDGMFPGQGLVVEQIDDVTFVVTRGS